MRIRRQVKEPTMKPFARSVWLCIVFAFVLGTARTAFALNVTGGDVPLPVLQGTSRLTWNGEFSDLLAADALAMCWTTQLGRGPNPQGFATDADPDIAQLIAWMGTGGCKTTCSNPAMTTAEDVAICAWLDGRKDPTCNIDAATSGPKALDVSKIRNASVTQPYLLPSAASLGLSGASAAAARDTAQSEVAFADLSLCMAEQLRDKLDTVQVAFASTDDLARVQDRVRVRALAAVAEYSVLSKAFASTQPAPTVLNDPRYYLIPLALWARQLPTSFTTLGNDFGTAVNLLVEATEASLNIKLRDPAGQESFGTATSYTCTPADGVGCSLSNVFLGFSGPRADALTSILYDGEDSIFTGFLSHLREVTTDLTAPQVAVLLGLARQANALKISILGTRVRRYVDATNLFANVENFVRLSDCRHQNIPPASCPTVSPGFPGYLSVLTQRYGIALEHATALTGALTEVLFGPPPASVRSLGNWTYAPDPFWTGSGPTSLFADGRWSNDGVAEELGLHLLGNHTFTGVVTAAIPSGVITIDANFQLATPRAQDIQAMRAPTLLPVRDFNPSGPAYIQFPVVRQLTTSLGFGSNTALAIAREALLQASGASSSLAIYNAAASALPLIDKSVGARQAVVRVALQSSPNPGACSGCVLLTPGGSGLTLDVITNPADTFAAAAVTANIPLAATLVTDPNTTTIWGTNHTSITSPAYTTMAQTTFSTLTPSYVLRSLAAPFASTTLPTPQGETILLQSGSGSTALYEHVHSGSNNPQRFVSFPGPGVGGTVVTFGGRFGREVEKAWEADAANWSFPRYDGFGLPRNWAPAADASLLGDSAGVSVEQHFVDRATAAAADATAALQQAFSTLEQEQTDQSALAAANARAQQLTTLQYQSLCGAQLTCTPSYLAQQPAAPACSGTLASDASCLAFQAQLSNIVGNPSGTPGPGVPMASAVYNEMVNGNPSPTFSAFSGGSLQGLFLSEWNAWNALSGALTSAMATAGAAIAQVVAADAEFTSAQTDAATAEAHIAASYAQLAAQSQFWAAQQVQYNANAAQYETQRLAAKAISDKECGENAFSDAFAAGFSFSGGGDLGVHGSATPNSWGYDFNHRTGTSFSPASLSAQVDRCFNAQVQAKAAEDAARPQKDVMKQLSDALQLQINATNPDGGVQGAALTADHVSAQAHVEVAMARQAAARAGRESQMASALQSVQTAYGQVLNAIVAIDGAYAEAGVAASRIALDQQLATYDVRTRFGVRTRFHSYDLWRARALTENARRLAVAARRAIEERYVVDLSTMSAAEPFVDSPSLWANDVYSYDLRPPFSVGLTPSPGQPAGTPYANALQDYVGNLKLFLDGFTIQRPTAAVFSDADVIQLPAPAAQIVTSVYNTSVAYIDPASSGWAFYCPSTGTWVADPNVASFTRGAPTWTLSTVCGGQSPTLARLGFWLDPWGRLLRSATNPPSLGARYNVRVGRLAVNLVGSGIRSCQNAPDPTTCYAEPFMRYDLKQVGPVWVMDFSQQWKSLAIPEAFISGGKALAIEQWLDPVSNGFNRADVAAASRVEFVNRPIGGAYELTLYLSPDVRVEQIERIQLLTQTAYWVRQQ
jgi:hypothetical protein